MSDIHFKYLIIALVGTLIALLLAYLYIRQYDFKRPDEIGKAAKNQDYGTNPDAFLEVLMQHKTQTIDGGEKTNSLSSNDAGSQIHQKKQ